MQSKRSRYARPRRALVGVSAAAAVLLPLLGYAVVTAVSGHAYGYFASVSLFGGPPNVRGPEPSVTLPPSGSAFPNTASRSSGLVQIGPAILFSSGPVEVSTQGTTGPDGSATSATRIQSVNTSGQEVFTAAIVQSSCTATEQGRSGSTTITGGTLQTSEGNPDVDGDETVVAIPTMPAPNTTYEGTIESVGDRFRYVFNEQVQHPDGSLTVYAGHQILLGPTAVGHLYFGHARCGVTGTAVDPLFADGFE